MKVFFAYYNINYYNILEKERQGNRVDNLSRSLVYLQVKAWVT